ncbi:MAG: L,D-transpeptidase family protein [Beijerinckiaceae bacterium]|nr:L,D-transpeptidase family protein [Beijerinckiaceae bacterium]
MRATQSSLNASGAAALIIAGLFLAGLVLTSSAPAFAQWRNYWGYQAYPAYPSNGYPGYPSYPAYPANPFYPESYVDPVAPPALPRSYRGRPYAYGAPYDDAYGPVDRRGPYDDGDLEVTVNFNQRTAVVVPNPTSEAPGTIVINTDARHLYFVEPGGTAIRYGIGVGRQGFTWKGIAHVGRKSEWPRWIPPKDMLKRRPDLPDEMDGGLDNPLGARALYLFQGKKDTMFRIHGTNEPDSIGKAVSSGCIRMMNSDVIDLYGRAGVGTRVVVM